MIPELAHGFIIMAWVSALLLSVLPIIGYWREYPVLLNTAVPLTLTMVWATTISVLLLVLSFLRNDFTVAYVAQHSHTSLPLPYKLSALWAGHEGSLLLWVLILSGYSSSILTLRKQLTSAQFVIILATLGCIAAGFLGLIVFTSNPFIRLLPYPPTNGIGLNPLLQDFGLIVHPPMLYLGYVGYAVCFAFAIAALVCGVCDSQWARLSRFYATGSWIFLTVGITLGSWWAYYELGWGGWWFWDPVENASFMPWLLGTALVHALLATEKRAALQLWSVLLALLAFALSLVGTFLVRSGLLSSVHTFASDPKRGVYLLVFLSVVLLASMVLFAIRSKQLTKTRLQYAGSRESLLVVNNLLLTASALVILLGTLYPLIIDLLGLGKLSVGSPYFNTILVPLGLVLLALMACASFSRWAMPYRYTFAHLVIAIFVSIGFCLLLGFMLIHPFHGMAFVGVGFSLMLCISLLMHMLQQGGLRWQRFGFTLAHLGFAVTVFAISINSYYSSGRDVALTLNQAVALNGYTFRLIRVQPIQGPNYEGVRGQLSVTDASGQSITQLFPEQRHYIVSKIRLAETAIDIGFFRDVYVALGEQINATTWSLRIYIKPFVRWLWLGGLLMAVGGLISFIQQTIWPVSVAKTGVIHET